MSRSRILLWLPAAAIATSVLGPVQLSAQDKPKKERDVIARLELVEADAKFSDLYEAVKRLRPHFVTQNRGTRSVGIQPGAPGSPMCNETINPNCSVRGGSNSTVAVVVYLDGAKMGDAETLKGLRPREIEEVRYYNANKAASELGLGHEGGAILVKRYNGTVPEASAES